MGRKSFNYIYEKLVKDENDILGHIAYSVYKNQKLATLESEFIRSHKTRSFMYGVMQGIVASFIFVLAGFVLLMTTGGWARIGKALVEIAK